MDGGMSIDLSDWELLHDAAGQADIFARWARLHYFTPREEAVEREGQALMDALWALGLRPSEAETVHVGPR